MKSSIKKRIDIEIQTKHKQYKIIKENHMKQKNIETRTTQKGGCKTETNKKCRTQTKKTLGG